MAHEVFVSYSQQDKPTADAVVAGLEGDGTRCWIASRDIIPGTSWGDAIVEAIDSSRVMVLVLSQHSNSSRQVIREVERAVAGEVIILPFRIDSAPPSGALAYFLGTEHWLDALTPPMERHIERLSRSVQLLLKGAEVPREDLDRRPLSLARSRRRRRSTVLVGAGVIAALAAVMALVLRDGDEGDRSVPSSSSVDMAASTTVNGPTTTSSPPVGLEEVARFQPIDLDPTDLQPTGAITGFDIVDDVLAYANGTDGVTRLSVGSPSSPMAMDTFDVPDATAVALDGQYLFAVAGDIGSTRLDVFRTDGTGLVSVPISPERATTLYDVKVADGYAYVSSHNYVGIVDVTDPAAPQLVFEWTPPGSTGNPAQVFVADGIGYFGAGWDGLYIFDLANPATPALLGHWTSPDWIIRVVVSEGTAYVTLGDSGLAVVDVSDPADPRLLGSVETPGFASLVDIAVGHAFVGWLGDGGSLGGVAVIDLSEAESPVFIDTFGRFPSMSGLRVVEDHVFVSDEAEDLVILRITGLD